MALIVAALVFGATTLRAESLAGVNVGDKAPSFELKNQSGEPVKLASLLQTGPVAVVFFRSADWCPYCQKHLIAIQEGSAAIKAAGLQLVAVSYDSVDVLNRFATKRNIQFPLLSDPGSTTIKAWKLLNAEAGGNAQGIPHPMSYIVGKDGIIRAKLGYEKYQARHTVQELVEAAKQLNSK